MKKLNNMIAVLAVVLVLPRIATAQDLKPADFAYGIQIDTVGAQPVQSFALPQTVYEHLTRDDLGDLRIFNGGNATVPHAIHYASQTPDVLDDKMSVSFFPIYGSSQATLNNLGVQVQRTGSGTLVRIDEQAANNQQTMRALIVDASQLEKGVRQLELVWNDPPENLLAAITVESSSDLTRWQPWGKPQTMSSMRYNESVLVRNAIALPARKATYYRLSWGPATSFPTPDQIDVTLASEKPEVDRLWTSVNMISDEAGQFIGAIPGTIPADRVEIELPDAQTIVRVTIESAEKENGPWVHRYGGLAYNLQAGDDQWQSAPISIYRNTHRYWRLTVDETSGVMLSEPTLRFGWTAARVLFVPQGPPPYTLAFGSAGVEAAGFNSNELFSPVAGNYDDVFDLPLASLGAPNRLGGEARLEATADIPWQQITMWAAMILGIAVLGTMALRLMRQNSGSSEEDA